jgi:pimeloyl-ACP methyl ester carboxylesterase
MADRHPVNDLVVVVPGILGSRLAHKGKEVWGVSGSAVVRGLLTFGHSLTDLALPDGIGDDDPKDHVRATGLMNDLQIVPGVWSPIQGYSKLMEFLRANFELKTQKEVGEGEGFNLIAFAYDWRLSNRLSAARLKATVEPALHAWRERSGNGNAKLVFLCHSMGGVVARYYAQCLGGAESIRAMVTFGTPHLGALKALDQLVHEQRRGWWKFGVDLTKLVRSMPSSYQLLPTYACLLKGAGEPPLRLDETDVPELDSARVADARRFHEEIATGTGGNTPYELRKVVGIDQPTLLSAELDGRNVKPVEWMRGQRDGRWVDVDIKGDGTVPRRSAEADGQDGLYQIEQHGTLHVDRGPLEYVTGVLTQTDVTWRARAEENRPALGIKLPDVVKVGEEVSVGVLADESRLSLVGTVRSLGGDTFEVPAVNQGEGVYLIRFAPPQPGAYEIQVAPRFQDALTPPPVTGALLAWTPELDAASR